VDTTYFIAYQKGSAFTQRIDSIADIKAVIPGDTLRSGEIKILDITKEWVVKIPALNKSYYFSDYNFFTEKCNCSSGKFQKVSNFKMNGIMTANAFVILE